MDSLRGKVAIVGSADTEVGKLPHIGPTALCIDAARRALDAAWKLAAPENAIHPDLRARLVDEEVRTISNPWPMVLMSTRDRK